MGNRRGRHDPPRGELLNPSFRQFLTETIAVLGDATNEAELEMVDLSDSSRMRDADRIISIRPAGVGPDRARTARPGHRVSEGVYGRERHAARALPRNAPPDH